MVVKTSFFLAIWRISQISSRSERGFSKDSGSACRIEAGTVWSISSSSVVTPRAVNIASISFGEGPMWRRFAKS